MGKAKLLGFLRIRVLGSGFGPFQLWMVGYTGLSWLADAMEMILLSYVGPAVSQTARQEAETRTEMRTEMRTETRTEMRAKTRAKIVPFSFFLGMGNPMFREKGWGCGGKPESCNCVW